MVITGGSLGAVNVNRAVAASAKDLLAHAQVIHLTGKGKDDEVRSLVSVSAGEDVLGELGPDHVSDGDYRVAPYLERIDLAFACADLIICRSGAGTVSELTALGLPAFQRAARGRRGRGLDGGGWRFHSGLGPWPCAGTACRSGQAVPIRCQRVEIRHPRRRRSHGEARARANRSAS